MTFRARIAIAAAAAVALAVVLISVVVFFVVRDQLRRQVDEALDVRADQIAHIPVPFESREGLSLTLLSPGFGEPTSVVQIVKADGDVLNPYEDVELPVPDAAVEVARGNAQGFFSDADIAGTHARMLTFQYSRGYAVQIARPLTEVDESLSRLRTFLIIIALVGSGRSGGSRARRVRRCARAGASPH